MKKIIEHPTLTLWTRLVVILTSVTVVIVTGYSQNLEVTGKVKVTEMDSIATGDKVVVRDVNAYLAERDLNNVVISYFLNLPNGIQTLLEAGELVTNLLLAGASVSDLLAAGVSVSDLLAAGVSVSDLVDGGATVAALLSNTVTPLQIFTAGVEIDSFYGKTYEGGLIFYLNTSTGDGLVSASTDQSSSEQWDDDFINPSATNATGTAIGTGQANTTTIVNALGSDGPAAQECDFLILNSKSDWFLPSKDELNEMYTKLKLKGFGGFTASSYWSSTEASDDDAWSQNFSNGSQSLLNKFNSPRVRAVRAF